MGRFNMKDAEHYGGQGGSGFFSIANDKQVKVVRFLYDSVDDIEGFAVHEVEVNGKKRYVNCIREYNESRDVCPFCKAGLHQRAKVFVPIYNVEEDQVQIWDRGKQFFSTLSGTLSRYDDESIVSQEFEIERNGKPKDTSTTYGIYRTKTPADDKTLDDFELPQILGTIVMDKTADEMNYYLEHRQFESSSGDGDEEQPVRRRSERRVSNRRDDEF